MSFEEIDTESSASSSSEVSSLNDEFHTMYLDFDNSAEEDTDDDNDDNMNSYCVNGKGFEVIVKFLFSS